MSQFIYHVSNCEIKKHLFIKETPKCLKGVWCAASGGTYNFKKTFSDSTLIGGISTLNKIAAIEHYDKQHQSKVEEIELKRKSLQEKRERTHKALYET